MVFVSVCSNTLNGLMVDPDTAGVGVRGLRGVHQAQSLRHPQVSLWGMRGHDDVQGGILEGLAVSLELVVGGGDTFNSPEMSWQVAGYQTASAGAGLGCQVVHGQLVRVRSHRQGIKVFAMTSGDRNLLETDAHLLGCDDHVPAAAALDQCLR